MAIKLHVLPQCPVQLGLPEQQPVPMSIDLEHLEPYQGEYEITPSSETHILHTKGMKMLVDVIVSPVPSNYGLIQWDGHHLSIS